MRIVPRKATFEFDANGSPSWFRVCQVTGKLYEVTCSYEQYMDWQNGQLIQNAMPNLSAEQREFIMTGYTPAEWKEIFKEEN